MRLSGYLVRPQVYIRLSWNFVRNRFTSGCHGSYYVAGLHRGVMVFNTSTGLHQVVMVFSTSQVYIRLSWYLCTSAGLHEGCHGI